MVGVKVDYYKLVLSGTWILIIINLYIPDKKGVVSFLVLTIFLTNLTIIKKL